MRGFNVIIFAITLLTFLIFNFSTNLLILQKQQKQKTKTTSNKLIF